MSQTNLFSLKSFNLLFFSIYPLAYNGNQSITHSFYKLNNHSCFLKKTLTTHFFSITYLGNDLSYL